MLHNLLWAQLSGSVYEVNAVWTGIGLVVAIALLILLSLKTKIHVFLALILGAVLILLFGGVPLNAIPGILTKGFGDTLSSIGIVIALGTLMGGIFEASGAAKSMARWFVKVLGRGKEEWALALTGFVVSIPIFCDSGFVILAPLMKSISQSTGKSVVWLGTALGIGLNVTHNSVPPTPGPLYVANAYGIDLGIFILCGLVVAAVSLIPAMMYAKKVGAIYNFIPNGKGGFEPSKGVKGSVDLGKEELPNTFLSFLPILLPIALIFLNTGAEIFKAPAVKLVDGKLIEGGFRFVCSFIGNAVPAVAIGTAVCIFTLGRKMDVKEIRKIMDAGLKDSGLILVVTGGGGILGQAIKSTTFATQIGTAMAHWRIPLWVVPLIIATIVRFAQGSGTVSLQTSSSIFAPIAAAQGASKMMIILCAMASCVGCVFYSYMNDSYFWVVTGNIGLEDLADRMKVWSFTTTIAWAAGVVCLLFFWLLFLIFGLL